MIVEMHKGKPVGARVSVDGKIVWLGQIIGTDAGNAEVYDPCDFGSRHGGTWMTFDGRWHIRVGTDPDQSKYEHLAGGSPERIAAVDAAYQERHEEAVALIRRAFPGLFIEVPTREVKYGGVAFNWAEWVAYQERAGVLEVPVRREG